MGFLGEWTLQLLPWTLVLFFVVIGLRLEKYIPRFAALTLLQWRLQAALRGQSRLRVAAVMGLATPILPCGPLYFLLTLSAFSGTPLRGAEFMLAFGLGTVPLLWMVQANYGRLRLKLSPQWLARLQGCLALVSALIISWRLSRGAGGFLCQ